MLPVSVIICSHNPREDYLHRVLDTLQAQTLPHKDWELLLIDSASKESLAGRFDLAWHPNARHLREDKNPRLRGIAESKGDLLVFVDDDNVLRSDYLAACLKISAAWPQLGAWSGSCLPEFEIEPPAELRPWLNGLFIEKLTDSYRAMPPESGPALPTGAGMVVRRSVASRYHDEFLRNPLCQAFKRNGNGSATGEDSDLTLSSIALGLGTGRFPELGLTHLIPAQRLTLEYLESIHEDFGYDGVILKAIHSKESSKDSRSPSALNSLFPAPGPDKQKPHRTPDQNGRSTWPSRGTIGTPASFMTDFPRLLVATEFPPNSPGGGGAVIRQMLKDWPAAKLFWWSCSPDPGNLFGQKVAEHSVAAIPPKLYPNRRWAAQKSWLLDTAWVPWAARHLENTLAHLKPDVVWAIPHCWSIPPLARVLPQSRTAFHVSVHDYMDHQAMTARFGVARAKKMAGLAEQLYAAATTRDAICRAMADDLRLKTSREGSVNHAGLEQDDFDYLSTNPPPSGNAIRIAYAGTIIAQKTFVAFVKTLGQIRHQLPLPVTLDFFGDHSYRSQEWFAPDWMKEHGNLDAAGLSRALKECTWGFAPMELTDDNPRYNRFSLPTKFVSYLAAGLPIITIGHPESTVVKVASQYDVGLCATSAEALNTQLLAALSQSNPQSKFRAEILRCALAEFDARRMRATLYENFQKCAATSR